MKKGLLLAVLCAGLLLTGCTKQKENTESVTSDVVVERTEQTITEEVIPESNAESVEESETVETTRTIGLPIGIEDMYEKGALCYLQVMEDADINGFGKNLAGDNRMFSAIGLSELSFDDYALYMGIVHENSENNDEYDFCIYSTEEYSVELFQEYWSDGVTLSENTAYPAYLTTDYEDADALFLYTLSDEHALVIKYNCGAAPISSNGELAQKLYDMVLLP